jgi:flagellar hook assembly protein FlgD
LNIYDVQGHLVKTLLSKSAYEAGEHTVQWDATDRNNRKVSTGIYFYQFVSGNYQKYGKMMLIK